MNLSSAAKIVLWVLLIGCILVLTKFILFKNSASYYENYFKTQFTRNTYKEGIKHANLVPFKTIKLMQSNALTTTYKVENVAGNIAGFIPLGFLFPLLFVSMRKAWKTIMLIFFISLCFETFQLITALGVFDVDDLILNTSGGIAGYLLYKIFTLLFAH